MSGGQIEVVTHTVVVTDQIIRPNDANPFSAGDVIGDSSGRPFRFKNCARTPGGGGIIQSAILIDSVAAATKPTPELYLFCVNVSMAADNAAFAPTDYEMEYCEGWIAFLQANFKTCGANGVIQTTDKAMAFQCCPGSTDLFGTLVERGTYTPAALETFRIRLWILQD